MASTAPSTVRRQAEQLRRTVEGAVLAMSLVVETRDPYTAGHERRVAELATAIAREMGMDGEALVVLQHDLGHGAPEVDDLKDVEAGRGVLLDEVELDLAEPARLGEDLGGHGDLADVVDEAGETQGFERLAVHAHLPGDRRGQLGDAALVAGGVR